MSCHSSAEFTPQSFLLPFVMNNGAPATHNDGEHGQAPVIYAPGSAAWMSYFQSRYGTNGMDKGTYGLDYDMMLGFKAYHYWSKYNPTHPKAGLTRTLPDNYRKFRFRSAARH